MRYDIITVGPDFTPVESSDHLSYRQVMLTRMVNGDYITKATDEEALHISDLLTKGVITFDLYADCYMINSTRYTGRDCIGKPIADITWFAKVPQMPFFGYRELFETDHFVKVEEPVGDFIHYYTDQQDKLCKV